jgi:hypothetical protein
LEPEVDVMKQTACSGLFHRAEHRMPESPAIETHGLRKVFDDKVAIADLTRASSAARCSASWP